MALPEDDRIIRSTGGFRDRSNAISLLGLIVALVILALIMMFMFMPRTGEPIRSIDGAARAPVTTTVPTTTPKQP
jgi:hypothetical protein